MKYLLAVLSLLATFLPAQQVQAAYTSSTVLQATNAARIESRLPALKSNAKLQAAAETFAHQLAAKDACFTPAWNQQNGHAGYVATLQKTGYPYLYAGQNLACGFLEASSTVQAWLKSPSHRANLLSKNYLETGIAIATSTDGEFYVVQYFGTPLSKR